MTLCHIFLACDGDGGTIEESRCNTTTLLQKIPDPERALFQYPKQHYGTWPDDMPECAALFKPGAFGENLSAECWQEDDVCIGDKVKVGSALLEVAQPFQPTYALNSRIKNPCVARKLSEKRRTGWYYRVLENGSFKVDDELEIIERPHPLWQLSRLLHYLYEETANREALKALSKLGPLAPTTRELFQRRLNDLQPEFNQLDNLPPPAQAAPEVINSAEDASVSSSEVPNEEKWMPVMVRGIMIESPAVRSFYLVSASSSRLTKSRPGAHLKVKLPNDLIKNYSLCNNSTDDEYHIAVGRNPVSEGGSIYLHDHVKVGDILHVSRPVNTFPIAQKAKHHILIAGGIGITPFLSMIDYFQSSSISYKLHFCTRSVKDTPFHRRLSHLPANRISFHHDGGDPKKGIDLTAVLSDLDSGAHVYCCGPDGLMRAVEAATSHLNRKRVHFESFVSAPTTLNTFKVKVESTGQIFSVGPEQTILQVLRENGIKVDSQCETGSCGTCIVQYSQGEVLHKDFALSPEERRTSMTTCVSRATSDLLILKL